MAAPMLLDVSQPVHEGTAHFPGDQPFDCGWSLRLAEGHSVNLSWVKTSPHVGTHVDAPYHFQEPGRRVGELDLDAFIGPALVIDARGQDKLDASLLRGHDLANHPRVLFRTQQRASVESFLDTYPTLTDDAIQLLRQAGVRLIGVDAPSVDPADSKDLPVHNALGRAGILNIENLRLDDAEAGAYELLAAPARWRDMDAAPVRAILRR